MGGFVRGVTGPGSPTDRPAHFPEEEGLGLEVGSQVGWGRDFQKGVGPCPALGGPVTTRAARQALPVIYRGAQCGPSRPLRTRSLREGPWWPHLTQPSGLLGPASEARTLQPAWGLLGPGAGAS